MIKDIRQGSDGSDVTNFFSVGDQVYFTAYDDDNLELWKTDGTEAGTAMVKDIYPGDDDIWKIIRAMDGILYFSAEDGSHGRELWKTDGTEAGTESVKDINSGSGHGLLFSK